MVFLNGWWRSVISVARGYAILTRRRIDVVTSKGCGRDMMVRVVTENLRDKVPRLHFVAARGEILL
jgi:hypothetical protein